MQEKIDKAKILNATKWSTFAEIISKLAAPIVNIVLARLLLPETFGVIASITVITSFADIFSDAGFQKYIIQKSYSTEEEYSKDTNTSFWSNLVISITLFALIFAYKKDLARYVGCQDAYWGIVVAGIAVICTSFSSTIIARYRRSMNFKPLFFTRLVSSLIPLIITIPLALILKSYWAMVIGTLSQQVAIASILTISSEWKPTFCFSISSLKRMIPFSIWNLMESLSFWFAGQANVFIVATTLSQHYLGIYKTSMATVNSYMSIITASITPVLFSTLSRCKNDPDEYKRTFLMFIKVISLFVIPMGLGLFLYRDLAVEILLGRNWSEASLLLGLWALTSSFTITFSNTACEVYRSSGKPKISFALQIIYLLVYIPTILYFVQRDFRALCFASSLIRIFPVLIDVCVLAVYYKINIVKIIDATFSSIISTILMGAVAIILQNVRNGLYWNVFSVILCIGVYFALIMIFPSNRKLLHNIPILKIGNRRNFY